MNQEDILSIIMTIRFQAVEDGLETGEAFDLLEQEIENEFNSYY